jgi:hypothetical protein
MFLDQDSGELIEDKALEAEIRKQTGEGVFLAKGGTNVEAALKDIAQVER